MWGLGEAQIKAALLSVLVRAAPLPEVGGCYEMVIATGTREAAPHRGRRGEGAKRRRERDGCDLSTVGEGVVFYEVAQ